MKNFLICIVIVFIYLNVNSQETKPIPPELILNVFNKLYPNVENVEWEEEGSSYEAEFVYNDSLRSVNFDLNGKVLEIETEPFDKKEIDDNYNENDQNDEDEDEEEKDDHDD